MLEYGYMLALNKPPALVRMVPFTEEGDGSSFWERRIIGNGTATAKEWRDNRFRFF